MQILALSPHTDDAELGAGGSIARWLEEGHTVDVVAFSTGNPRTGSNKTEFSESMHALGVSAHLLYNYETRRYNESRQDILDQLIVLRNVENYDLVLIPSTASVHQDHEVIAGEAVRAFRESSILGYELPWSSVTGFDGRHYVKLNAEHVAAKIHAMQRYESQRFRGYTSPDVISSLATIRGAQIKTDFAECFEVVRWVA